MNKEGLHYIILISASLGVAIILTIIIRRLLNIFIKKYAGKLKTDPTNFSFLKNSVGIVIYSAAIIFIFYHIPYLKSLGAALFAGVGLAAIVVGFASQKAFANIISGIFILIFKPYKIGDTIEFKDGLKGIIEEITLRHTVIKNYEERRIIIPNSIISDETIINSSIQEEKIRNHLVFSISYDSDIDKAISIIEDEVVKHPNFLDNRTPQEKRSDFPKVLVRVIQLGDFSVDLKAYIWSKNNDEGFALKCDLLKSVKQRFDREGVEIPFPYRTIVYKKDLKDEKDNSES